MPHFDMVCRGCGSKYKTCWSRSQTYCNGKCAQRYISLRNWLKKNGRDIGDFKLSNRVHMSLSFLDKLIDAGFIAVIKEKEEKDGR